jgi:uncharacterized membrane protein
MRLWLIPMVYLAVSAICGLTLPRLEQIYLTTYTFDISVASAQAYLSAVASGMMALTGIVFAMAFVMVQFSAIAFSPRLVLWLARDPILFNSLGIFAATFIYALFTLGWVDRGGSGTVPLFSTLIVGAMLLVSMLLFARLIQSLGNLQITNVLQIVGGRGRKVIGEMFKAPDGKAYRERTSGRDAAEAAQLGAATQTLRYSGEPRAIAKLNIDSLVRQGQQAQGAIVMACAVGDTVVEDTLLLEVRGGKLPLADRELMRAITLERERTFEQDPKYPIRLLVDVAIKALSPAINDPTTAVQTIDQLEDLLYRLGRVDLDAGYARDAGGVLRLVFPMPTWEDYLTLAFDEIRQFGGTSVQVIRRLRSALVSLADSLPSTERVDAVRRYLGHLDLVVEHSPFDAEDRVKARQGDRQGLGLSRGQSARA